VGQASVDVVLEDEHGHLVGGRGHGLDLLEDVQAVRLVLDQALESACLAFDPTQSIQELFPVAGVAVSKVGGIGGVIMGCHTPG